MFNCWSITGYPLAFLNNFLTVLQYPFKYSWMERGTIGVNRLVRERNKVTQLNTGKEVLILSLGHQP